MELRINSNGQIALFVVKGKIGWDNSRILDSQIHKMVEKGCSHIVFNLDEVTFLCSGGIGALIYNMKKVQETGGDIYIVSNSDYIQFLFATIGFNIIFNGKIFKSFEEFSAGVLKPKGMVLNLGASESSLINTEEHRFAPGSNCFTNGNLPNALRAKGKFLAGSPRPRARAAGSLLLSVCGAWIPVNPLNRTS